jgi:exodeoxyribonuclease VIII
MSSWDDEDTAPVVERHVPLTNGIHRDVSFDRYLKEDRVSKTLLWDIHDRSPAHARIGKEESNAMKVGTATHCVMLEPDHFRLRFVRGPDDRRGNRWKDALAMAAADERELLTAAEYDAAIEMRDAIKDNPYIRKLTGNGAFREITACANDPETGLPTRMRADAYVPGDGILIDLKTTRDARPVQFTRAVREYGYHLQEAHYTKTWANAGGSSVAFIFAVVEPFAPFAIKIYELDADAIAEGEAIRQRAMATWAECLVTGVFPAYPQEPETLSLRKFDFQLTVPVNA